MRKGVITYGLQRVGQELSDDAAASASQAIDQRVWHIFSSIVSLPWSPPSTLFPFLSRSPSPLDTIEANKNGLIYYLTH